jgi:hypothetical protein
MLSKALSLFGSRQVHFRGTSKRVWRDYNQRAITEQRIEELKDELNADGFCMKQFLRPKRRFCRCSLPSTFYASTKKR